MSVYSDKAMMCLYKMSQEMARKNLELGRQTKLFSQLLLAGMSPTSIPKEFVSKLLMNQFDDGGFVANTDSIWSIFFLSNYEKYAEKRLAAIKWLEKQKNCEIWGRTKRDIPRIPTTGLLLDLIPELRTDNNYESLMHLWISEKNSLTYKAAYLLLAFSRYKANKFDNEIKEAVAWLESQQEDDGGFAPWKGHPVASNVYCTGIAVVALLRYPELCDQNTVQRAYDFLIRNQMVNGLWAYHEIEDGGAWGLRAMIEVEKR